MADIPKKHWGMTPPLSDALPEETDIQKNKDLIEELKREKNYEAASETERRVETLKLLQNVTTEFVREVSKRQGFPDSQIEQLGLGGKVYPYGSYRLGVFGPGSDIDTLAVAPRHVKREHFFELFPQILRRMAAPNAVSSLTSVPDSYVPIIKLVLNGIEIDLIFVSIATLQVIPDKLKLNDNKLLDGLDNGGIRAITGPRVTDEILSLVPDVKAFRTALRAIKLWAQRRAIYANIVGYPGGVAWAMLVARVCQLYPMGNGAIIASRFFFVMKDWKWPTPIMLKEIESGKEKVWNPKIYPGDKRNIMPIITPAYPSMCSTYNISKSGKAVIQREFERGYEIATGILHGTMQWGELFQKHTFFTADHRYYLSVIASSTDQDAAKAFAGLVESKVRHLVRDLEDQSDVISLARPYTKGFKRVHKCENAEQVAEIRKGSMKYKSEETTTVETTDPELVTMNNNGAAIPEVPETKPVNGGGAQSLYTHTFYIGLDLTPKAVKNLNISGPITNFKTQCWSWSNYNPEVHDLNIVPCKGYELPDDVFDAKAGEVKPTKPVKAAKKSKKRAASELEDKAKGPDSKRPAILNGHSTPTPVTPAPA